MKQKLLTKEIERKLPKLYATEKTPLAEKAAIVRYFNPTGIGTWYGIEYDPSERLFWGIAHLHEWEWGYFSLTELESLRLPYGMHIERDICFRPQKVSEISELKSYVMKGKANQ